MENAMAKPIKTKIGLLKVLNSCSDSVQSYFEHLPKLLDDFPLEVTLAYCFARLELGQNMALYCGAVKLHRANAEIASSVVSTHRMDRKGFLKLYETVYGFEPPEAAGTSLKTAENTRDTLMHGKKPSVDSLRNAIARVLEYSDAMNSQLNARRGLRPFGDLRGFAGKAKKLDRRTTVFMLRGMGFNLK